MKSWAPLRMASEISLVWLFGQEGLGDEVLGTLADGVGDQLGLVQSADDHDLGVGIGFQDSLQGIDSVGTRHHDVQRHSVRMLGLILLERLLPVGGLARHLPAVVREALGDHLAHQYRVVHNQHTLGHVGGPFPRIGLRRTRRPCPG